MSDARDWQPVQPGMTPESNPSPSTAALWRVPLAQNEHFTGRDELLASLHEQLHRPTHGTRTIALLGPAGVGKTQVALEYAYRNREEYPLVHWLSARTEEQLEHDLYLLARDLHRGEFDGSLASARAVVLRELSARPNWLLIFDGAPNAESITGCLPARYRGHVLVTSRDVTWRGIGTAALVPAMERGESMAFLKYATRRSSESVLPASQLAKALGDFPLALTLAAHTITQAKISFEDYLNRFENLWAEMLQSNQRTVRDGLALSLELAYRQLSSTAPAAVELMNLLAFYAPDGFQRAWLTAGEKVLVGPLAETVREFAFLQEALSWLAKFGFIELKAGQMSVDETVATFVRARLPRDAYAEHAHLAMRLMDNAFRFDTNDPRTWSEGMAMLPHASVAVDHSLETDVTVASSASLLNQIGQCLFRNGRYEKARQALDRGLAIAYRVYGENNPRLSAIANNLGRVLLRLGEVDAARHQFEWALTLDEATYGPTHPHVAEVLNNFGTCLIRLRRTKDAAIQFERALDIYETHSGPSHPSTASIINNIGYTKMVSGDLAGAWDLLQRALGVVHATYGPNHPDVASILLNLGDVLRLQGSQGAARAQYQRALLIDEICYGPSHPDVARDASHIGAVLLDMNDPAGARKYFERAMAIDEGAYGRTHRNLIPRLEDLGRCLKQLGEVEQSALQYGRAAELVRLLPAESKPSSNDSSTAAA